MIFITHTHVYILLLQCVVESLAFAKSLQDERCLILNQEKLNDVPGLFGNFDRDSQEETLM